MATQIPLSGLTPEAGGILLPDEQGQMLTNGLLETTGALALAGDARTTGSRKTVFPIWLGEPTAGPVGEGERKPVTGAEFGSTDLHVKKFASIVLFTDEQIEDVQNGDMNVLVDSGVRKALAKSIDSHVTGQRLGAPITSVFDSKLRDTSAAGIPVDFAKDDGLQRAISAAMGVLESNGYEDPSDYGVLLGTGFKKGIRDAREAVDSNRALYDGSNDPLYGLARNYTINVGKAGANPGAVVGYVVNRPNIHVRIRHDVRLSVSRESSVETPDGETVHLWQDNMTGIRYEVRLGHAVHDIARAVVPLVVAPEPDPAP